MPGMSPEKSDAIGPVKVAMAPVEIELDEMPGAALDEPVGLDDEDPVAPHAGWELNPKTSDADAAASATSRIRTETPRTGTPLSCCC